MTFQEFIIMEICVGKSLYGSDMKGKQYTNDLIFIFVYASLLSISSCNVCFFCGLISEGIRQFTI